jgi:hypothetical protein
MNASSEVVQGPAAESSSIAIIVADCMSATSSRIRILAELAFVETRLVTIGATLLVLMGMLSAVFVIGALGLVAAGFVSAVLNFGFSLWLTLASPCGTKLSAESHAWSEAQAIGAKKPDQANDNQIDGNDVTKQARYDQDKDSCNQRYQRGETQVEIHDCSVV